MDNKREIKRKRHKGTYITETELLLGVYKYSVLLYNRGFIYLTVTQNRLRTQAGKLVFVEKKIRFVTALDLINLTEIALYVRT